MDDASKVVRRLWALVEHLHAVTYFAPESRAAFEDAGLRGFWRGYFAGRAAPMGAVGAGVVEATFFGFHRDFVARAVPGVWDLAAPQDALDARLAGASAALGRMLPAASADDIVEAAELLASVDRCHPAGRPLFAANLDTTWPDDPFARLWVAATRWREHRGDGHVAALVAAGIDGCESHVLRLAVHGGTPEWMEAARGWSAADVAAANERLVARHLVEQDGTASDRGRAMRAEVEVLTDHLATPAAQALGPDGVARLEELLAPLARAVAGTGEIPYPNPMGLPAAT